MISSEEKSHSPKAAVPINRITGPFTARQSSEIGFEIVGGDGTVSVWVVGQWNADVITALLNLAHKRGDLEGDK